MCYAKLQRHQNKMEAVCITTAAKLRMHVESNVPEQERILLRVQGGLKNFLS